MYLRADSQAYGANYLTTAGVGQATASLQGASATTAADGTFALQTPGPTGTGYQPITATATGYAQSWWPWSAEYAIQTVSMGLYPEVTAKPRPGFLKGVMPHDVGGFFPSVFSLGLFPPTFDRIHNAVAGDYTTLVDTVWLNELDIGQNKVKISGSPPNGAIMSATPAMYRILVPQAHARNLKVMMMLQIYPDAPLQPTFWSTIGVPYSNTTFWNAWFDAYRPLVVERALIAKELGIEQMALGLNHSYMSNAPLSYWTALVAAVRATGYSGKLSYFGGAGDYGGIENLYGRAGATSFMQLFDYIGVTFYSVVVQSSSSEVLSNEQTRLRMRADIAQSLNSLSYAPVPILLMFGTPSVHGGAVSNDYIEPCLQCNSLAPQRTRDFYQQADVYQAAFETFNDTPIGNGRVMGFFTWGYHFLDDFTTLLTPNDSAYDKSGNVRGKPAEAVMKYWFSRWAN